MRVLPPGGPPQRVSSGPFPGAEPHVLCKAKPVNLEKVACSHFFDSLNCGSWLPLLHDFGYYALFASNFLMTTRVSSISAMAIGRQIQAMRTKPAIMYDTNDTAAQVMA